MENQMDELIIINRPIDEVFAFVTDHSNDKLWKPFVTESWQISAGPINVGTRFEIVTVAWGYRRAGEVEVLGYEPHRLYVYRANDKLLPFVARLNFEPLPSGTGIRGHVEFQAHGLWKWLTPILLRILRSQSKHIFARLKQVIEGSEEKVT